MRKFWLLQQLHLLLFYQSLLLGDLLRRAELLLIGLKCISVRVSLYLPSTFRNKGQMLKGGIVTYGMGIQCHQAWD